VVPGQCSTDSKEAHACPQCKRKLAVAAQEKAPDSKTEAWKKEHSKRCPNCSVWIEKNGTWLLHLWLGGGVVARTCWPLT
jgi:hypothetical protein